MDLNKKGKKPSELDESKPQEKKEIDYVVGRQFQPLKEENKGKRRDNDQRRHRHHRRRPNNPNQGGGNKPQQQ